MTDIQESTERSASEEMSELLLSEVNRTEKELQDFYPALLDPETRIACESEMQTRLASYRRASANMTRAALRFSSMTNELGTRFRETDPHKKSRLFRLPNSRVDLLESESTHFARGMNVYKLLLICYIGSFFGVLIEMLWCLVTNGYLESRAGLVWGPFNLLYGVGAVVMTFMLYPIRNHSQWVAFAGGFLVGSLVEYLCSFLQEMLFGSRSWDYSHLPFQINGRICLFYSLMWGGLGIVWVKMIYPYVAKWILKIPEKVGRIVTLALLVFFILNTVVSALAVYRWSARLDGVAPAGFFWEWIDAAFPNSRMEQIYANMTFD